MCGPLRLCYTRQCHPLRRLVAPRSGFFASLLQGASDRLKFSEGSPAGRRAYWCAVALAAAAAPVPGDTDGCGIAAPGSGKKLFGIHDVSPGAMIPQGPTKPISPAITSAFQTIDSETRAPGAEDAVSKTVLTWGDTLDRMVSVSVLVLCNLPPTSPPSSPRGQYPALSP